MSPESLALAILLGVIVVGVALGFAARRKDSAKLEEWAVGGRGFGYLLVWLLMAGEIYTTYALLGLSGWAYSKGGPTLYALGYLPLGQIGLYFLWPQIWEVGRKHVMHTLPDFFATRYRSRLLTLLVAVVGIASMMLYVQIQLLGLGSIVAFASGGEISRGWAIGGSAVLVAGFVFTSGVRGVAWVSVLKDGLLGLGAIFVGIAVPWIHFGGIGPMFAAVARARPGHLTMPGSTTSFGHTWYITSVLLSAIGIGCWPHTFGSLFTAKSAEVLRRNAIMMPLYSVTLLFVVFAGIAAILVTPGLSNGDLAFMSVVKATFSPWFLGLLGGAGALTAMVPAASLLLSASTLVAKNIWVPVTGRTLSGPSLLLLARSVVIAVSAFAGFLAYINPASIAGLLLMAYSGVTQFAPGIILGLFWRRVTGLGVGLGVLTGVVTASAMTAAGADPFHGFNAGFVGLVLNGAVTVAVSLASSPQPNGLEAEAA